MSENWPKTSDRFVAFFDIMGFKNLVNSKNHDEVIKLMDGIAKYVQIIDSRMFSDSGSMIKTTFFSDSILIITNNNSLESAIHIMIHSAMLFEKVLSYGIPIKGCISFGKFTADFEKSLFVGQPLIDSFLLQEELYLYSIILHHSFETFMSYKKYGEGEFPNNPRWIKYLTPFKNGRAFHYHINWLYYTKLGKLEKDKYFMLLNKYYNSISGKTRAYVDNTLDLYDKMVILTESEL